MKFVQSLDLNKNQLLNAKLQVLASDPSLGVDDGGMAWYNSSAKAVKVWDGTAAQALTNVIEQVVGSGPVNASLSGKKVTVSADTASGGSAGLMSAADFTKLAGATALSTASALVQRDASGNFSAGTITAALSGTASNADRLNNQTPAYYLSRGNHTGSQPASTISDLDAVVRGYRLDQFNAPSTPMGMGNQRLTGVADPVNAQDAATKNYVDSVATGLDVKNSVRVASTGNLALTYTATAGGSGRGQITGAPKTVDGVTLAVGDRVLLKDQTTTASNGIWTVTTVGSGASGVWDRATDFDTDSEVSSGAFMFVEAGTQAATGWVLTTLNPITVGGAGGSALTFAQFNGSASYSAGAGLSLSGSAFTAVGTANRISVSGSGIDIDSGYVGQTSIKTLGTVTSGTWSASTIALAKGGTGATNAAAARSNLSATGKYATDVGDGSATSVTLTHNLNTLDVAVTLYEKTGGAEVLADVTHTSVNAVVVSFSTAPANNSLRAVVVG